MRLFPSSSSSSSSCAILAAALSKSYRSYESYDPSIIHGQSLENFLDTNGILLTMCMQYNGLIPWLECPTKTSEEGGRVAASWIQQNITGFRVVSPPIDIGYPVGLVLKPSSTHIRCTYPADAATNIRDNDGCGVLSTDPKYGSQGYDHLPWYRKMILQEEIIHIKNNLFGKNRTWDSIPCKELFINGNNTPMDHVSIYGRVVKKDKEDNIIDDDRDDNDDEEEDDDDMRGVVSSSWSYQSVQQYIIDQWSYIMGHKICNATSEPLPQPSFNSTETLIYTGLDSWEPNQWNEMIELMGLTLQNHSQVGTWNELVLNVTDDDYYRTSAIQAVFYVKTGNIKDDWISRRIAIREVKKLGNNKPLLYVNQQQSNLSSSKNDDDDDDDDIDLFHCDNDYYQPSYLRRQNQQLSST